MVAARISRATIIQINHFIKHFYSLEVQDQNDNEEAITLSIICITVALFTPCRNL